MTSNDSFFIQSSFNQFNTNGHQFLSIDVVSVGGKNHGNGDAGWFYDKLYGVFVVDQIEIRPTMVQ